MSYQTKCGISKGKRFLFENLGLDRFLFGDGNQGEVFPYSDTGDILTDTHFGKRVSGNPQHHWNPLLTSEFLKV